MAKKRQASERYEELAPLDKLKALARTLRRSAERCDDNMLTSNSWMSESFEGAAERIEEIVAELEARDRLPEGWPPKDGPIGPVGPSGSDAA